MKSEHKLIAWLPAFSRPFARALPSWCLEATLFVVVGGAQLLLDWAAFVVLSYAGCTLLVANVVARFAGAMLGFWLNGRYTFLRESAGLNGAHLARFVIFWLIATLISTLLLEVAHGYVRLEMVWLAKPVIEAMLAVCSFLVSRNWVYR